MLRANSTKPVRNTSKIVDLQKRNLNSELTVTIPTNDNWTPYVGEGFRQAVNENYSYSIINRSVIGMLAESELFLHFAQCFDQFKIMDHHLCIDVSKAPFLNVTINNIVPHLVYAEVFIEETGSWVNLDSVNIPHEEGEADFQTEFIQEYRNDELLNDPEDLVTQPITTNVNCEFPFIVGACSRRTIPYSYFQTDAQHPYENLTWNQMMSYGSAIYQSKMPGASVHLSLDVQGTSNCERMMTFPTECISNLGNLTPAQQNGRFCPFVYTGLKTKLIAYDDNEEVKRMLIESINALTDTPGQYDGYHDELHIIGGIQYLRFEYNGQYYKVRAKFNFDWYIEHEVANQPVFADCVQYNPRDISYQLSVQGYTTVRFKQLRTTALRKPRVVLRVGIVQEGAPMGMNPEMANESVDRSTSSTLMDEVRESVSQDDYNAATGSGSGGNSNAPESKIFNVKKKNGIFDIWNNAKASALVFYKQVGDILQTITITLEDISLWTGRVAKLFTWAEAMQIPYIAELAAACQLVSVIASKASKVINWIKSICFTNNSDVSEKDPDLYKPGYGSDIADGFKKTIVNWFDTKTPIDLSTLGS